MSNRTTDQNGYLYVKGCPLSSYGIFDYSAAQLGLPGDPNRIVKVFRPESAISEPEAIDSFKDIPLINDHEMLSGFQNDGSASAPEEYGIDGVLTGNVYYAEPWLRGDLKLFSRSMQQDLANGKKELSLGYSCKFEEKPGVFNGQPYEVVQHTMRGNHIALVDRARVAGARVLDGLCFDSLTFDVVKKPEEESEMKRNHAKDNAVEELKRLLPALAQYLNEEATEPAHQASASSEGSAEGELAAEIEGNESGQEGTAAAANEAAEQTEEEDQGEEVVDPTAQPAQAQSGGDLPALIGEIKAVLAKLEAACAGNASGDEEEHAASEETGADEHSDEASDEVEGLEGGEGKSLSVNEGGDNDEDRDGDGKASAGPAEGKHAKANDAALRGFYADLAAKDRLYKRLSAAVGAFDHAAMDAGQVAVYGVKKLGLKCAKGTESFALDAYLTGREKAAKEAAARLNTATRALDSATGSGSAELDAYLQGK